MSGLANVHKSLVIEKTKQIAVSRDEYLDYMTFKSDKPVLFTELMGPMVGLKEEWRQQGASHEELRFSTFRYKNAIFGFIPVQTGWLGGQEKLLEETDEYVLALDCMRRHVKLFKHSASLPLPLDHPVKDMTDWLKIKHHYEFSEDRFEKDWQQTSQKYQAEDRVMCATMPGAFYELRDLMGDEELCMAYYTQPELVHDMLDTIGNMVYRAMDIISSYIQIDQLSVAEDLAGKSGPLVGPRQIEEFIKPYYHRIWDLLQRRGCRLFALDSDGNIDSVLDALIDAGINTVGPMEPAAGMDIVQVRRKYGNRLAITGGIDKHVLRGSKDEIVAELEYKIPPMVQTGACVLGLDHRVTNGTPLDNYRFYVQIAWEIIEREEH